ncbi:hypothetical protein SAMN05421780_101354 [Flexibacter flexilis DSM 6793]|uniref:Uncharacterized protein n=1 Tax=Flexibacter flexilis DSM 6793 TaxID=927664 RepID=A0A1I1DV42_9BACT|nr:hypothetical protein [Flexibacter flexilis]SFB76443.1 hypothetical protein SAMN05421780_101354 [Flexibacter flexilis DSM 6793]
MNKIRYSLEDIRGLVNRFENVKQAGILMITELKELINENPQLIELIDSDYQFLYFRYFDLNFLVQIEVISTKIENATGVIKTYMMTEQNSALALENVEFTFDDSGNIQLKDDLYILTTEVFPYFFVSKLTEFVLKEKLIIRPQAELAKYMR